MNIAGTLALNAVVWVLLSAMFAYGIDADEQDQSPKLAAAFLGFFAMMAALNTWAAATA